MALCPPLLLCGRHAFAKGPSIKATRMSNPQTVISNCHTKLQTYVPRLQPHPSPLFTTAWSKGLKPGLKTQACPVVAAHQDCEGTLQQYNPKDHPPSHPNPIQPNPTHGPLFVVISFTLFYFPVGTRLTSRYSRTCAGPRPPWRAGGARSRCRSVRERRGPRAGSSAP